MAVVKATEEFERWIEGLSHREQKAVLQVVKILEQVGRRRETTMPCARTP